MQPLRWRLTIKSNWMYLLSLSGGKSVAFWGNGDKQQYKWCKSSCSYIPAAFAKQTWPTASGGRLPRSFVFRHFQSTRCTTNALPTEALLRPTCRGSRSRRNRSPTPIFSRSASSTRTPLAGSSQRTPTCRKASLTCRQPFACPMAKNRRPIRAPAPCSSGTLSSRWSWTASRSERRPTEQCLTPTILTHPAPVSSPGITGPLTGVCCVLRYSF